MYILIALLFLLVGFLFWKVYSIKKEFKKKTTFFWKVDGDFKVLINEKGEEITRL